MPQMERNSIIFYRSFYEAIKGLPGVIQCEIYTAIMEYGLYGKETENMKTIARGFFMAFKPQIDANAIRFENGCRGGAPVGNNNNRYSEKKKSTAEAQPEENENDKEKSAYAPKKKADGPASTACGGDAASPAVTEGEPRPLFQNQDYDKFLVWLKENCPYFGNEANIRPMSEEEFLKLKNKYTGVQISRILLQIENRKDLRRRYSSMYLTTLNWLKNEYGKTDS